MKGRKKGLIQRFKLSKGQEKSVKKLVLKTEDIKFGC